MTIQSTTLDAWLKLNTCTWA